MRNLSLFTGAAILVAGTAAQSGTLGNQGLMGGLVEDLGIRSMYDVYESLGVVGTIGLGAKMFATYFREGAERVVFGERERQLEDNNMHYILAANDVLNRQS